MSFRLPEEAHLYLCFCLCLYKYKYMYMYLCLCFRWPEVWRHLVVTDTCLASGR